MTDPSAVSSVAMTAGEAVAWLAVTAGGAVGASIAAYRQYLKRCAPDAPKVQAERTDALIMLSRSFEAFAATVGAFIIHVQEQHESHRREMARQTEILDRLSQGVARIEVRQELAGK